MKRVTWGRTGLSVSELCFGTLNFGWRVAETQAFALLDAFHAAGGNFIQATSIGAAGDPALSIMEASEEFVGRWWRARKLERAELFMATRLVLPATRVATANAMEATIRLCCEQSMQRFRTDYLDLVLIEWNDALPPLDDALLGLGLLKRAGLIRSIGASGFSAWRFMEAWHRSVHRNLDRFEVAQADYSLLHRERGGHDLLKLCEEYRVDFLARAPLASGALCRPPNHPAAAVAAWAELTAFADRHRATVPQVALAWVLSPPVPTVPVMGVSTLAHLRELLEATQLDLTRADFSSLPPSFSTGIFSQP